MYFHVLPFGLSVLPFGLSLAYSFRLHCTVYKCTVYKKGDRFNPSLSNGEPVFGRGK